MAQPPSLQIRLAQALRARREALGVSQEAFADRIGVHRTYWGAVERGKQNLTLTSIERFAAEKVEAVQTGSYVAELARSNASITVPAGKSLLDALLDAGITVMTGNGMSNGSPAASKRYLTSIPAER